MPLIAVNLSDKLIQDIRTLVDAGVYASLEGFVEIGAFNQLALERAATPDEIIARGHRSGASEARAPRARATEASKPKQVSPKLARIVVAEPVTSEDASVMFNRMANVLTGKLPAPSKLPPSASPGERIFGQVNRLFPIKLVCRWVAHHASIEGEWPKFTAISSGIADDAGTLGSLLDQWDKKQIRDRGTEMATALPRRKNNASIDRFLSQFVARITRSSEMTPGAVCQYGLARFDDASLTLTEQGVAFAALENQILDGQNDSATFTLSDEESRFLVNHIRNWVPIEWNDMGTVLTAVRAGKTTPTEVGVFVRKVLPREWSDSMIQTHVSGVIARLSDIRLLRRSWQGRNVNYTIGESAQLAALIES
jgi:hypothetical protein